MAGFERRHLIAGAAGLAAVAGGRRLMAQVAKPADGEAAGVFRLDPAMDDVVDRAAPIEILGTGYRWAEGPVWVKQGGFLLFSDVPSNIVHRWQPGSAPEPFLDPSGHPRPVPPEFNEAGSNGLALDSTGRLLMADSGNRAIVRLDLASGARTTLVDRFEGKRFNSPNDLTVAPDGSIWFTDPPYGLKLQEKSPLRELAFNGLYRLDPAGNVSAVDRSHHRPNGVTLSPDGRTLYLALSDPERPYVLAYALGADGLPAGPPRLFHDGTSLLRQGLPGLPDGLKTDREGRIYATGPGGVHVLTPEGKMIGRIATGTAVANCAFGEDGRSLLLTSHDRLARVRLKASAW